ncbi:serine threonine kinase [Fusarium phyllophilum]|uniref:Serine threonine kinase n=1 Tax=Fusarium phyllophilum TaxID=47803 RepID=A0A8H5MJT8_9HYPO|nr:serine threonine kinase [Fusarium phyllophilum]
MAERLSSQRILDALNQMCIKLEKDPAYSEPRARNPDGFIGVAAKKVHTQNASQQPLEQTVDADYCINLTTQSDAGTQVGLSRRFACPFYKAGIQISSHHRACEGPGFFDVNKAKYDCSTFLKEHLFRRHLEKEYRGKHICRRCYTGFKTDEFLQVHAHQEPPCAKRTPAAAKGMLSGEQAFQLRSLRRKSSKESDEDRWFDIYRIVFPKFDRKLENISPYHENNSTPLSTLNSSTSSNGISQYKDYLRNRDAEDYAAKLAKMGIDITAEAAAKVLELQVKDLESFDETMREPVQAYGFQIGDSLKKTGVEESASATELVGSAHLFGPFQLLAKYADDKEH